MSKYSDFVVSNNSGGESNIFKVSTTPENTLGVDGDLAFIPASTDLIPNCSILNNQHFIDLGDGNYVDVWGADSLGVLTGSPIGTFISNPGLEIDLFVYSEQWMAGAMYPALYLFLNRPVVAGESFNINGIDIILDQSYIYPTNPNYIVIDDTMINFNASPWIDIVNSVKTTDITISKSEAAQRINYVKINGVWEIDTTYYSRNTIDSVFVKKAEFNTMLPETGVFQSTVTNVVDLSSDEFVKLNITGNITISANFVETARVAGKIYMTVVDITGGDLYNVTWSPGLKFANGIPPTFSSGIDRFVFVCDGDGVISINQVASNLSDML